MPRGSDVERLIERYNQAWNEQDLDAIASMHAPGIVFENHTAGEQVEGADQVRAHIGGIFERWPDLRFRGQRLPRGATARESSGTASTSSRSATG